MNFNFFLRLFAFIFIITIAFSGNQLSAAGSSGIFWSTYHRDSMHTGRDTEVKDFENPSRLNLIWAFPRDAGGVDDESLLIVDNGDAEFQVSGRLFQAAIMMTTMEACRCIEELSLKARIRRQRCYLAVSIKPQHS